MLRAAAKQTVAVTQALVTRSLAADMIAAQEQQTKTNWRPTNQRWSYKEEVLPKPIPPIKGGGYPESVQGHI